MNRITVQFVNADYEESVREWAHQSDVSLLEHGVEIEWDFELWTFIPWSNVLRIDQERCYCQDCKRIAQENAVR